MTRPANVLSDIEDHPDVGITMPDGCRLSAQVWRPADAGENPVPAILEFLPYRKHDGTAARDALTHPWFAKRGYACVRVDMRGNGDSEGLMEDEYTQQELDEADEDFTFQPAVSGTPLVVKTLRETSNSRRIETDQASGETRLIIEDDFGLITDSHHGLTHGGTAYECWTIHPNDPLTARGYCHWTQKMSRDGIDLRTESSCDMWSDRENFFLRAKMNAFENEASVFSKETEDAIPRIQM